MKNKILIFLVFLFSQSAFSHLDTVRYPVSAKTLNKCAMGVIFKKIRERGYGEGTIKLTVELDERESNLSYNAVEIFEEMNKKTVLFIDFEGTLVEEKIKFEGSVAILAKKSEKGVDCSLARHFQIPHVGQRSFELIDKKHRLEMD